MSTPEEFLTDLAKDFVQADPMDRQKIVRGYARHMEAREKEIRLDELTMVSEHLTYDDKNLFLDQDLYVWIWETRAEEISPDSVFGKNTFNVAGNSEMSGEV